MNADAWLLHSCGCCDVSAVGGMFFRYPDIVHSIHLSRKGNAGLRTCDGHDELLKFLRSDIIEVSSRLEKGGLGFMENTAEFEEQVRSATDPRDLLRVLRIIHRSPAGASVLSFRCETWRT